MYCEWNSFIEAALQLIQNPPSNQVVDSLVRERIESGAVELYDKRRGRSRTFIRLEDGRSFTVELVISTGKKPWIHSIELDPEDL